jgi:hypothetical protein
MTNFHLFSKSHSQKIPKMTQKDPNDSKKKPTRFVPCNRHCGTLPLLRHQTSNVESVKARRKGTNLNRKLSDRKPGMACKLRFKT